MVKKIRQSRWLWLPIVTSLLVSGMAWLNENWWFWVPPVVAGGTVALIMALVWWHLAPNNLSFAFVEEGTCKVVDEGGAAVDYLLQWEGYVLDDNWNVIPTGTYTKDGKPLFTFEEKPVSEEELVKIEGIGSKKSELLMEALEERSVETLGELKELAHQEAAREITGISAQNEQAIGDYIEDNKTRNGNRRLFEEVGEVREATEQENGEENDEEDSDNENDNEVVEYQKVLREVTGSDSILEPQQEDDHLFSGLRLYGVWPIRDIHGYEFTWTSIAEDGTPEVHEEEPLDYITIKEDQYLCVIEEAEDAQLLPLTLFLLLRVRIVNPKKALFEVENWLEALINRTRPAARDATTQDIYDNLIEEKEAIGDDIYRSMRNRRILESFREDYGAEVEGIGVMEINPSPEHRDMTLAETKARYEKRGRKMEAEAEKKFREIVAEGDANATRKRYTAIVDFGPDGLKLRKFDAAEKSELGGSFLKIPDSGELSEEDKVLLKKLRDSDIIESEAKLKDKDN